MQLFYTNCDSQMWQFTFVDGQILTQLRSFIVGLTRLSIVVKRATLPIELMRMPRVPRL